MQDNGSTDSTPEVCRLSRLKILAVVNPKFRTPRRWWVSLTQMDGPYYVQTALPALIVVHLVLPRERSHC